MNRDFFPNYGPVWMKNWDGNKNSFMPDGLNCGPIISNPPVSSETSDIDRKLFDKNVLKLNIRKQISRKFPYKFPEEFLRPLQMKVHQQALLGEFSLDKYHSNLLSSFTLQGDVHLVYGECCSDSFILRVANVSSNQTSTMGYMSLDTVRNLTKFHYLYQTDCAVINCSPYALARVDDSICCFRLKEDGFAHTILPEKNAVSCCLNRRLNNYAYVNTEGSYFIYDINMEKFLWKQTYDSDVNWFGCEFGNHPQHLNVTSESTAFLVDTRHNGELQIFDLKEMSKYTHMSDIICSFKNIPENSYSYVICSETVHLMDNRHCKSPVLSWNHMLTRRPSFPNVISKNYKTLCMIDPFYCELCILPTEWSEAEHPDISAISTPKYFYVAKDTLEVARKEGIWFSHQVESEFFSPVVGLKVHPVGKTYIIILQNKNGSLFYKTMIHKKEGIKFKSLKNGSYEIFKQCDNFKVLKSYEKQLCEPVKLKHPHITVQNVKYIEGLKTTVSNSDSIIVKSNFKSFWNIGALNSSCSSNDTETKHRKLDFLERFKDNQSINYFSKDSQRNLSMDYLKSCSDEMAKNVLNVWSDVVSNKVSSLKSDKVYRRFPLHLDDNTVIQRMKPEGESDNTNGNNSQEKETVLTAVVKSEVPFENGSMTENVTQSNSQHDTRHSTSQNDGHQSYSQNDTHRCKSKTRKKRKKLKADGF